MTASHRRRRWKIKSDGVREEGEGAGHLVKARMVVGDAGDGGVDGKELVGSRAR